MIDFTLTWTGLFVLIGSFIAISQFVTNHIYGYWKRKGVYSPKPSFPGGNLGKALTGKIQTGVRLAEIYNETKQHPFVGLFLLHSKTLMVNDLELLKHIMIKDFQYFPNHGFGISPENDPLSNHLFNMEGAEWKMVRAKLTPTFTSSKMKYMFDIMLNCSQKLEKHLEEQVKAGNEVDFKETLARYSTDVIGSCAFGIETNSFLHPNGDFRRMGRRIFTSTFFKSFVDVLSLFAPSLIKTFQLRIIYEDVEKFIIKTVKDTIKYREENNVTRNDFLQLLIDMKKQDEKIGNTKSLNTIEIASQVFLFFAAGFETSSSTASYALFELAKNPEIQKKLRANIKEVIAKYDGKITYESIGEMDYLTQVIEESLRMYPPLPFLFRRCVKDYQIPNSDVVIEKGTLTLIPLLGIHRDPNIYESPMEFRPERFSPENKPNIHPMSYMPFGEGPRICIGNRFGMMQTRLGIISTLFKYEVTPCKNTKPMKFEAKSIILQPEGNQLLRLTPIK